MLDATFLPLLFTMATPPTWPPTDYFPSMSRAAWSSNTVSGFFNPSDIRLIEPIKANKAIHISAGNIPAIIVPVQDDVRTILEQMFLKNDLIARLEGFADLPADWAGDETHIPSSGTISAAKTLLLSLSSDQALPQVSPSADGEIGFTWLTNNLRVEALIYPDNHLVWLWTADGIVNPGGEGLFNGSFPEGLLDKLANATA